MKKAMNISLIVGMLGAVLTGCAMSPGAADLDKLAASMVKASFRDEGIVKVGVLEADETLRACAAADVEGKPLADDVARALEAQNLKTVQWPTDGKWVGDWKVGEQIAQSGRGLTFSDPPNTPNGGNCYNCHQIDNKEISYGTIGPSLYNYGKIRQVTDLNSPQAKPFIEFVWAKIWNAKAFNACSNMPRAGHKGILTQAQIRDLVALLLDPKSPVNQ